VRAGGIAAGAGGLDDLNVRRAAAAGSQRDLLGALVEVGNVLGQTINLAGETRVLDDAGVLLDRDLLLLVERRLEVRRLRLAISERRYTAAAYWMLSESMNRCVF
jgi:hypothetical protein